MINVCCFYHFYQNTRCNHVMQLKFQFLQSTYFSIIYNKIRNAACMMHLVDITLTVWIKTVFKRDDIHYFHEPSNFLSSVSSLRYLQTNYSTLKADASSYRQFWVFAKKRTEFEFRSQFLTFCWKLKPLAIIRHFVWIYDFIEIHKRYQNSGM